MNKIFKYYIPCMFVALGFASCYDTMDDKSDIDAQHESAFSNPAIVSATADATSHSSITITASVENADNVAEEGIQFSENQTFTTDDYIAKDDVEASYSVVIKDLTELTTYYYRAYAVGKNGSMVYGDTQSITTPEAPSTPLEGVYTAQEVYNKSGSWIKDPDTYKITISFEDGSTEKVNITNIWGAGTTVHGIYDAEKHVISVPSQQLLYTDPDYGPLLLMGMDNEMTKFTDDVTFEFTPRGGAMKSSIWACLIATGTYAGYTYNYPTYIMMQHD